MVKSIQKTVSELETIVGVLIPCSWDEQFKVTRISLACDSEREILIGNLNEHPEIHKHIRNKVRVVGRVFKNGRNEIVDISSFTALGVVKLKHF